MPPVAPSDEDSVFTLREPADDSQVCEWRMRSLMRLGVDAMDASKLEQVRDVAHTIGDLIDAGCPPHLAARIVL